MRRTVAIGGFMATGKSTVGALLARRLSLPFVDLDAVLVASHGPIAEQFARDGEAAFRVAESAALATVLSGGPCVLATGGGTWCSAANQRLLSSCWRIVLTAPLAVLRARVGAGKARPLWDGVVDARWSARQAAYADADAVFETSGWTPQAVADAIADRVTRWEAA